MEATLLVKLNVPDISQLPLEAEDVMDDLLAAGHDVLSVVPWQREQLAPQQLGGFNPPSFGQPPNPA